MEFLYLQMLFYLEMECKSYLLARNGVHELEDLSWRALGGVSLFIDVNLPRNGVHDMTRIFLESKGDFLGFFFSRHAYSFSVVGMEIV